MRPSLGLDRTIPFSLDPSLGCGSLDYTYDPNDLLLSEAIEMSGDITKLPAGMIVRGNLKPLGYPTGLR